jgi:hypothetical protein
MASAKSITRLSPAEHGVIRPRDPIQNFRGLLQSRGIFNGPRDARISLFNDVSARFPSASAEMVNGLIETIASSLRFQKAFAKQISKKQVGLELDGWSVLELNPLLIAANYSQEMSHQAKHEASLEVAGHFLLQLSTSEVVHYTNKKILPRPTSFHELSARVNGYCDSKIGFRQK